MFFSADISHCVASVHDTSSADHVWIMEEVLLLRWRRERPTSLKDRILRCGLFPDTSSPCVTGTWRVSPMTGRMSTQFFSIMEQAAIFLSRGSLFQNRVFLGRIPMKASPLHRSSPNGGHPDRGVDRL